MVQTQVCCQLCFCSNAELKDLVNENGQSNEIYEIAAKYFDPKLLTTAICLECWQHIDEFHKFQQYVLEAQANLNNVEIEQVLKLEMERIEQDADSNQVEEYFTKEILEFGEEGTKMIKTLNNTTELPTSYTTSKEEAIVLGHHDGSIVLKQSPQRSGFNAQKKLENVQGIEPNYKLEIEIKTDQDDDNILEEDMNMPVLHSDDFKDNNPFCSDDEISLDEIREFEDQGTEINLQKSNSYFPHLKKKPTSEEETLDSDNESICKFKCTICDREFNNGKTLRNHKRIHLPGPDLCKCPYCPKKLKGRKNIPRHVKLLHPKKYTEFEKKRELFFHERQQRKQQTDDSGGLHQCPHCPNKYNRIKNLHRHINKLHSENYIESEYMQSKRLRYLVLHYLKESESVVPVLKDKEIHDTIEDVSIQKKTLEYDAFIAKWQNELECAICKNRFRNFRALYKHFQDEHPNDRNHIICCENKLWSRGDIVEHILLHLNPNAFKCEICEKCCTNTNGLNSHIQNCHSEDEKIRPFECEVCHQRFFKKSKLRLHAGKHSTEINHMCKLCDRGFSTVELLKKHNYNAHTRYRLCDQCGKYYQGMYALERHRLTHEGIIPPKRRDRRRDDTVYKCSICGKVSVTKSALYQHKRNNHHTKTTNNPEIKPVHRCIICGELSPTKADLYQHKKQIHGFEPVYNCSICGEVNPTKAALYHHKRIIHEIEPNFECTICNKKFRSNNSLREHAVVHTGLALFQCPHCPTKFKQKKNIRRHLKLLHPKEFSDSVVHQNSAVHEIVI